MLDAGAPARQPPGAPRTRLGAARPLAPLAELRADPRARGSAGAASPGPPSPSVPGTQGSALLPSAPCRAARRPHPVPEISPFKITGHGAAWNIPASVDPMAKSTICAVESGRWWLVNVVFKTGESPSLQAGMKDGGSPRFPRPVSAASRRGQFFFISLGMRKPVWENCRPGVLEAASTAQKLFARAPDTFGAQFKAGSGSHLLPPHPPPAKGS